MNLSVLRQHRSMNLSFLRRGIRAMPEVDSRLRFLKSTEDLSKKKDAEKKTLAQNASLFIGGTSIASGSTLILDSYSDVVFTQVNLGLSLMSVGIAVAAFGSETINSTMFSQPIMGSKRLKKSKFKFNLLNESTLFESERKQLEKTCQFSTQGLTIDASTWPENVKTWLEKIEKEDIDKFNENMQDRKEKLNLLIETSKPRSVHDALSSIAPKAFVIEYSNEKLISNKSRHQDQRTRAENFGEEVSMLLSLATSNDMVVIDLESPGGAVSEFGLAASHILRLKQAGIKTVVTVDKVAASGGFMMACCADEIVAAPFAFLGSIGVVAELPNVNKALKRHDVDYLMFTAGEFKRTVSIFGENTEEGKNKFQNDLDNIHIAFKDHVDVNRGGKLSIDQVATGEVWLAVQCQKYGLVDRLGTSWDIKHELAKQGRDVIQVSRIEKDPHPLRQFLERSEVFMEDIISLIKSPLNLLSPLKHAPSSSSLTPQNSYFSTPSSSDSFDVTSGEILSVGKDNIARSARY